MKAHISWRSLLHGLDVCFILCFCFALLNSRECSALNDSELGSDASVKEVREDSIKSYLSEEASRLVEESKSVGSVNLGNENGLRSVNEPIIKQLNEKIKNSEEKERKVETVARSSEKDEKSSVEEVLKKRVKELHSKSEPKREQKTLRRRYVKRIVRRHKRNEESVNPDRLQNDKPFGKSVDDKKAKINHYVEQNKNFDVEGIRRLDINVEEEEKKELPNSLNVNTIASEAVRNSEEIKSNINDEIQDSHLKNFEKDLKNVDTKQNEENFKKAAEESSILDSTKNIENIYPGEHLIDVLKSKSIQEKTEGILNDLKTTSSEDASVKHASSRAETLLRLQTLRDQAIEFQSKIRNNTLLQSLKNTMSEILPGIPKFTENQFLEILKNISSKMNLPANNDFTIEMPENSELTSRQIEILKCAQQLVAQKERQSFLNNITECIRGLNVLNCMRIFIYPLIVENMPEVLTQAFSNFPIEINVPDLFQGNRDKPKSGRQVQLLNSYSNRMDPDTMIYNILSDGLAKRSPYENLPSFIDAKNESFAKLLTCNRLQLLQMTEKFLPAHERQSYSDEMLSCIRRFEYFSCIKYFSWPTIKKYYSGLSEFPLSDSYLSSLIYPNYPLVTYPGHLPEVVDSGPARMRPEAIILNIFRKTLNDYSRFPTPPSPIQLDLLVKSQAINSEQMASIQLAEQLLPMNIRAEYVYKTLQCIRQFDYYNCMKYSTWPIVKQFNPSIPNFQEILNNFQFPEFPQIPNLFDFFSQFQFPQFQFPQFQLPEVPNFSIPDFSSFFPFGQQTTTPKPPIETPSESISEDKKNDTAVESQISKILKNLRDSMGATPLSAPTYTNRKIFLFPLMTEEQSKIFALSESIVPPLAREPLITSMYFCLNDQNPFSVCAKTIIWPSLRNYIKGLPEFPMQDDSYLTQQKIEYNLPFTPYTGNGDDFFIMRELEKYFSEGREDAMYYIIRSIQLYSTNSFNTQKLLEILRSIQFNTPEFTNVKIIEYPRISVYKPFLTENQENIVHAVESILSEEIKQKFSNDMLDCIQKNKFPFCSRNVIFPSIYRYFQNALSSPYNMMSEKKPFLKTGTIDPSKVYQTQFETRLNIEKQNENIIPAKKFMSTYPLDPESIILSILRKVQLSAKTLPDFPKESIVNTAEFRRAFGVRQMHILSLAESLLPEDDRKGFLEEVYRCIQKDTFLNCTRDIVFLAMKKAYSDFPPFPDFENDFNKQIMLSTIESLKMVSSLSSSDDLKKTLSYMDPLYKLMPEDKSSKLRILISKLPDSLYYSLYVKMAQCTLYSDNISCSHDIMYPALKQYYDAPGFNIDDYYPITAESTLYPPMANMRSPFDYEILCENMGFDCTLIPFDSRYAESFLNSNISPSLTQISYMPYGKLPDGSRIFKRSQDVWNLNFTPSVGTDKTITNFASGSSSFINFAAESSKSSEINVESSSSDLKNTDKIILNRSKRNVDDLLDSYPDAVSNDKTNSVPRRIPPKSTFPNITETELLQMLIHISKLKNEPILANDDIIPNEYFVDSLNDTERALITADQYEILKLVQGLNAETAKAGFMRRVYQCIRSLSFIRCVGIFVWPMIASNLPSLPFNFPENRNARAIEEMKVKELFGISPYEFEMELINRKKQIESNLIQWYKTLTENKFEKNLGSLKIIGHGDGEVAIKFSNFREGRLSKIKDNKNLPSILTIISDVIEEVFDTKANKTKNKKESSKNNKRSRTLLGFEEPEFEGNLNNDSDEDMKRSVKDDQVINMLLEKLRPSVTDIKNEDIKHYFNLEDAYRAFQVLFGPKISSKFTNQLKFINTENLKNFENIKPIDEISVVPLELQKNSATERLKLLSPKSRAMNGFDNNVHKSVNLEKNFLTSDKVSEFKTYIAEYMKKFLNSNKKNIQTGLLVRLPRLNDNIENKKMTNNLNNLGRSMKKKMMQIMPGAGVAASFIVHLTLAKIKAAASVANLLSNMALGSAMFGMVRDMLMGSSNDNPKIKYVYETEKYDTGISWPASNSDPTTRYSSPYMNYNV